jgi:hypothetical protein
MCNNKLERLKQNIVEKKKSNLYYSNTDTTASMPRVKMSTVYVARADEDNDILTMIDILIGSDD